MPVTLLQASFTGGEWAPALWSRTDLQKYSTACRTMRNFIALPYGGAVSRPGTEFVAETKANGVARLMPFQYNVTDSYVLEFGDYYMRAYRDGGQIVLPSTPTAWNSGTAYVQGDHCSKSGTNYYALQAGTNKDPATQTAYWYALESDIVEIQTPYAVADVFDIRYAQSADTIYLAHKSYAPQKLTRSDHHVWKMNTISWGAAMAAPSNFRRTSGSGSGNRFVVASVDVGGRESLPSSTVVEAGSGDTLEWDDVSGAAQYRLYVDQSYNGGRYMLCTTTQDNICKIPNTSNSSVIALTQMTPFSGANNYPAHVCFYQGRLWWARSNNYPQNIWGSRIGDYENHNSSVGVVRSDDAFAVTIDSGEMSEIRGLLVSDVMLVFTSGGEWVFKAGDGGSALTPSNVSLKQQSRWGAASVQPLIMGESGVFVQYGTRAVRDIAYNYSSDGYVGNDLAILAYHLLDGYEVKQAAFQRSPYSVLWSVRDDGTMLGLTYMKEHEVFAWHRHDTDGTFESVASITDGDAFDEVYTVVNRTIGGNTKRYVERFVPRFVDDATDDPAAAFQVDSGLTYDGSATATISGLDHLEGETVVALADGNVVSGLTVASGDIALPFPASVVHVGMPYTCQLETMELDAAGDGAGTIMDRRRVVKTALIRLQDSRGVKYGPSFDRLDTLQMRSTSDEYDAIALFTGEREVNLSPAQSFKSCRICIENDGPVPITVLALYPRIEVGR